MSGVYAVGTKVPVSQSRDEIERTVRKYGADQFIAGSGHDFAVIGFTLMDRQLKFFIPIKDVDPREERRLWRVQLITIKANLEAVTSGLGKFDQIFLPNIVLPNGQTFGQFGVPQIESAYKNAEMPPLLTGPTSE